MVDPEDDLTDVRLPEPGTEGHLTLLLAEHLARGDAAHRVEELQGVTRDLAARHRTHWRKAATEPGAEVALTDASLERLAALRLIERRGDRVRALPALARFAVAEPIAPARPGRPKRCRSSRSATVRDAPTPATARWQPLRLGLIDLFYYDEEVFPFVDGRLLLRGNNGTGKSKVLALTLPFLLDGDLSPRRVEPDADTNKRMEWNLLLGGAHPHGERLGYTWIEFGRLGDDGAPVYRTLGAGLKAGSGRMLGHWFFITSQRVGEDLALLDTSRTALGRERLAEALGDHGRIYDTKGAYRHAVDETLFGLGERRYDALVDLLVQIRQPQLSRRPNEGMLSDALTRSLSPVPNALINVVAEGFRGLDDEREQLAELADTTRAVAAFLEHYRAYARVIARRKAEGPRLAQSKYEQLGRDLLRVREELEAARAAVRRAEATLGALRGRAASLEATLTALMEGEHAEGEAQLAAAEREATGAHERFATAMVSAARTETELAEALERGAAAEADADARRAARDAALADAGAAARPARVTADHAGVVGIAEATDGAWADAKRRADDLLVRRRRALARVRELIDATDRAAATLAGENGRLDDAAAHVARALEHQATMEATLQRTGDALVDSVRAYLDTLVEVRLDDVAATADELRAWVATLDGPNPATAALTVAADEALEAIGDARTRARARADELTLRIEALDGEIAALASGRSELPPARHTRAQDDLPGLPLWRSVDFMEATDQRERAGIEAALEAAGILDAHVLPGGEVRSPNDGELLLKPRPAPASRETLASVLRPRRPRTPPAFGRRTWLPCSRPWRSSARATPSNRTHTLRGSRPTDASAWGWPPARGRKRRRATSARAPARPLAGGGSPKRDPSGRRSSSSGTPSSRSSKGSTRAGRRYGRRPPDCRPTPPSATPTPTWRPRCGRPAMRAARTTRPRNAPNGRAPPGTRRGRS